MKTVIFACVHNAGRSQSATAWANSLRWKDGHGFRPDLSGAESPKASLVDDDA